MDLVHNSICLRKVVQIKEEEIELDEAEQGDGMFSDSSGEEGDSSGKFPLASPVALTAGVTDSTEAIALPNGTVFPGSVLPAGADESSKAMALPKESVQETIAQTY